MKKILFLSFALCLLLGYSCKEDDFGLQIHHDGENFSAPALNPGNYLAAARLTNAKTGSFTGRDIDRISFFLVDVPDRCEVIIFGEGSPTLPGPILYSQVVNNLSANSWNHHDLADVVGITGPDIWIGVEIQHNTTKNSIGCDAGPAAANGDWIFSANNVWQSFRTFTNNEVDINWNIRARVAEE